MNIAIIPARGGSKRIPKKNIKPFAGKPIIAYSIEAAKATGLFDSIIVSTDSEEIAKVAKDYGAEVPFMRPAEVSDDLSTTSAVMLHAIEWLDKENITPDYLCCIYATAPFARAEYIQKSYEILLETGSSSVFPVTTFPYPIQRALQLNETGRLEMLSPEYELVNSNDLPEAYHDAGLFYWLKVSQFRIEKRLFAKDSTPLILPRYLVQDIDTPEDWERAQRMYLAYIKDN